MTRSEFVELIEDKTKKELESWQNLKDTKISVIRLPLQGKSLYIIEADYADRTVSVNLSKYYNLYENEITNTINTPDSGISFLDVIANQIASSPTSLPKMTFQTCEVTFWEVQSSEL